MNYYYYYQGKNTQGNRILKPKRSYSRVHQYINIAIKSENRTGQGQT